MGRIEGGGMPAKTIDRKAVDNKKRMGSMVSRSREMKWCRCTFVCRIPMMTTTI